MSSPHSPSEASIPTTSAGDSAPSSPGGSPQGVSAARSHIVIIVMENHSYGQIIDSSSTPYLTRLARTSVTLTHAYAIRHPSLPNYIALTSGSTHGINSDCTTCYVSGQNLVDQLEHAGITWKAYMESMPTACYRTPSSGRYYLKHNPFMYYNDIRNNADRCARDVPYSRFSSDLAGGRLPQFAWITPNICNDMHDCSPAIGDAWAKQQIPPILSAIGPTGVVILTFDESSGADHSGCCDGVARGGNIPMIIAGPGARAGTTISTPVDLHSLLRLIEDNWKLPHLAGAATAPAITGWKS